MSRRIARTYLMKELYAGEWNNPANLDDIQSLSMEEVNLNETDLEFIRKSFLSIQEHIEEIDHEIEGHLDQWSIHRIPKVDLAILRIAVNEILFSPEIPEGAIANEAVELAKEYSTSDSYRYINGVLGKMIRNKAND